MLQVISALDSKPSRLSEESINVLAKFLPVYLMDVIQVSYSVMLTPNKQTELSNL